MDYILILEIIGTIAFAFAGSLKAIDKNLDIFGICVIGLTSATGGGVIRDLLLGKTPPSAFKNPIYAEIAIISAIITFLPFTRIVLNKISKAYDQILLIADSIGLAVFTIVGLQISLNSYQNIPFLAVFVGVLTGVGGGILSDMMLNEDISIFVKKFYASASLIGSISYLVCLHFYNQLESVIISFIIIVLLRLLAAKYHWNLPKAKKIK